MSALFYIAFSLLWLGVGTSISYGWIWITHPWQRPLWKPFYKPSAASLKHLSALIKLLSEVHAWLGPGNNPICRGLQKGLWEQINYLKIEQDCCTIIFSRKSDERIWNLRRLSKNKTRRVQEVIQAISEHGAASEEVRDLAKSILQENAETLRKIKAPRLINNPKRRRTARSNTTDNPVIYSENTIIHMEDGTMSKKDGDTYNVGQAGAVGPDSQASNINMSQDSNQNYNLIDAVALNQELETLRQALRQLAQSPEEDQAVGAIASAEIELRRGDRSKALEYLKQAGRWAFDVATKIGVGLAAAALKTALGL